MQQLVVWLYTGKLDLDERKRVEWTEVATRLGIGMGEIGALRDDQDSKKIKDVFVKEDGIVVTKKQFGKTAMNDSVLNSFKSLSVNDSLSRHTRRQFCDVDIFTSDDDSFIVGDGDNINIDVDIISSNNIAVDIIKPVSSGVQCDLSFEEEDAEFIEDIGENIEDTSHQLENSSHEGAIVNISNGLNDHDAKAFEGEDVKNQTDNVFTEEKHHYVNGLEYENYHDDISKDVKNQDANVSNDVKCDDANISNVLKYHDATTSVGVNCSNLDIITDVNVMDSSEKCDVNQISDVSDGDSDVGNTAVEADKNETVYQDCEEEFDNRIDEPIKKETDANDNIDTDHEDTVTDNESDQSEHSYESDPSSGNGSEEDSESDDPSWRASSNDASDHSDEESNTAKKDLLDVGDALPISDISNVNISSLHTSALCVCPAPLATTCQCKGSCVRSCVCRSGGQRCSRRCSCQPSKCRWREGTEESKEKESEGAVFQESNLLGTSYLSPQITVAVTTTSQTCDTDITTTDYSEASFLPPPTVNTAVYSPSTVLCTPSCQPIPMSASTSLLSTTARKRNRKKLFTETVGPQEL